MAQSEISCEKIRAYLGTDYRVGHGTDAITLRINTRSESLLLLYASSSCHCGTFITACNPYGATLSAEINEAAHKRLGAELSALACKVIEGAGVDPNGEWPEEQSYLGLGVDLVPAKELGKRYRQDAIVWMEADAVPKLILLR